MAEEKPPQRVVLQEEKVEEKAPSVDSTDREERIKARRARLRERLAKEKAKGTPAEAEAIERERAAARTREEVVADDEKAEVDRSLEAIAAARREADAAVGNFAVEAAESERKRREAAESQRALLLRRAAEERNASAAAVTDVRAGWKAAATSGVADDMAEKLADQQRRCDAVLASRDKVVTAHRALIRERAEEFQKLMGRYSEQVDSLVDCLRQHFKRVDEQLDAEMARLEKHLEESREQLRKEYAARLDALNERRSSLEERMSRARLDQKADDIEVEDSAARRDAEECAQLKARLEEEVQALQLSLQQMKATYLMNTEKLDHNMKVLAQREALHSEQIAAGRARINRLQDVLTQLKTKSARLERQYAQRIAELTDEFGKLVTTYKDYNKKFSHFREADTKKLEDMWALTRDRARENVEKLLTADRIIHERVLGLQWCSPLKSVFDESPVVKADLTTATAVRPNRPMSPSDIGIPAPDSLEGQVLAVLGQEASFLIDESKARNLLEQANTRSSTGSSVVVQSGTVPVAALLEALHVTERADVERLLGFFLVEAGQPDGGIQVTQEQALAALRAFVKDHERDSRAMLRRKDKEDLEQALDQERRMQEEFWRKVMAVISPHAFALWNGILQETVSYQEVLRKRVELVEGNKVLRQQNEEMRVALGRHITNPDTRLRMPPVERQGIAEAAPRPAISSTMSATSKGTRP